MNRPLQRLLAAAIGLLLPLLIPGAPAHADSIRDAARFVANIFRLDFRPLPASAILATVFLLPILAMHGWTCLIEQRRVRPLSPFGRAAMAGAMAYATLTLYNGRSDFIYFQF